MADLKRFLLVLLLTVPFGCDRSTDRPRPVAEGFIAALKARSTAGVDSLVSWESLLLADNFCPRDFLAAQGPSKRQEIIESYKKLFYNDYLPLLSEVDLEVEGVFIARTESHVQVDITIPGRSENEKKTAQCVLQLALDQDKHRWLINDVGDMVRFVLLKGDFDPAQLYLSEPINTNREPNTFGMGREQ